MVNAKYFIHGVCLGSNVTFPEFAPLTKGHADIILFLKPAAPDGMGELPEESILRRSYYHRPQGGTESFSYYGFSEYYVARWHFLCDFQVFRDGSWIVCYPWEGAPWEDIRPFFLGRILPLALNLRGVLTLHSGGALLPQGAIGLVAKSGSGKSTLTTSLACQGWPLIADDVLATREEQGHFFAEFGSAQVRLTDESLEFLRPQLPLSGAPEPDYDKSRVYLRGNGLSGGHPPLRSIYLLERKPEADGSNIKITTLPPNLALSILMRNINSGLFLELPQVKQQFSLMARLVSQVPVKILGYPSGFEMLPQVCDALLSDQGGQSYSAGFPDSPLHKRKDIEVSR